MIAAALFVVTPADIIRKRDLFLGVDIPAKATLLVAGGASMPCSHSFVWLENESVYIIHRFSKNRFALSALSAFWLEENAESAENAGLQSYLAINSMTYFLKVNPGETPDKILESALRHRIVGGDFHTLLSCELIRKCRHYGSL